MDIFNLKQLIKKVSGD